jgi:hypothetical protein
MLPSGRSRWSSGIARLKREGLGCKSVVRSQKGEMHMLLNDAILLRTVCGWCLLISNRDR